MSEENESAEWEGTGTDVEPPTVVDSPIVKPFDPTTQDLHLPVEKASTNPFESIEESLTERVVEKIAVIEAEAAAGDGPDTRDAPPTDIQLLEPRVPFDEPTLEEQGRVYPGGETQRASSAPPPAKDPDAPDALFKVMWIGAAFLFGALLAVLLAALFTGF